MTPVINLLGKKFNRLTVVARAENNKQGKTRWLCKCECGNTKIILGDSLRSGKTTSCGCVHSEISKQVFKKKSTKHDMCYSRIYKIWRGIEQRCYYPKHASYKYYGAKGIKVCQEWLEDFMNFYNWAINNGYSDDLTIDRINVNGNYEPNNCRWINSKEQARNRGNNHLFTFRGETHCITEWAEIYNLSVGLLNNRISKCKWDFEKAITTPIRKKRMSNTKSNNYSKINSKRK